MRKKYGIIGEQIWLGTSIPIETATVDAIAQDVYWEIVRKENHKEASEPRRPRRPRPDRPLPLRLAPTTTALAAAAAALHIPHAHTHTVGAW